MADRYARQRAQRRPAGVETGRGRGRRRVHSGKVILAALAVLNLLLQLCFRIYDRKEVLRIVRDKEEIHVLAAKQDGSGK